MFDKLYKEANDEIRVNTQLLEELKSEASKGKKQKMEKFKEWRESLLSLRL